MHAELFCLFSSGTKWDGGLHPYRHYKKDHLWRRHRGGCPGVGPHWANGSSPSGTRRSLCLFRCSRQPTVNTGQTSKTKHMMSQFMQGSVYVHFSWEHFRKCSIRVECVEVVSGCCMHPMGCWLVNSVPVCPTVKHDSCISDQRCLPFAPSRRLKRLHLYTGPSKWKPCRAITPTQNMRAENICFVSL